MVIIMKYCGKCGAELKDDAKFCDGCGAQCPNESETVSIKKPEHKKTTFTFTGAAITLIVALALAFTAVRRYNNPEQQVLRAVESRDYTTALDIVSRNQTVGYSDELINKLNKRIDELESGYEKKELEYEQVQTELNAIEYLGVSGVSEELSAAKKTVYDLYCSRTYQTVYLKTSSVNNRWDGSSLTTETYNWNYDNHGRLTEYGYSYEYPEDTKWNFSRNYLYSYSEDGNISGFTYSETGEESILMRFTSTYEDGLLTGYNGIYKGMPVPVQIRFSYDENGNFSSVEELEAGISQSKTEYVYDENGNMRDRTIHPMGSWIVNAKFDDNGYLCEQSLKIDDEYQYRNFYNYNEYGHLCNETIYSENNTEPSFTLQVKYTYDNEGHITKIDIEENGYSASGTFQGSDAYRTLSFDGSSSTYGDMTIVLEYDDAGNLKKQSRYVDDELQYEVLYTYMSLELPLNYEKPDTKEPIYAINQ